MPTTDRDLPAVRRRSLGRRLLWLLLLWLAGVTTLGVVALGIRWLMNASGLSVP